MCEDADLCVVEGGNFPIVGGQAQHVSAGHWKFHRRTRRRQIAKDRDLRPAQAAPRRRHRPGRRWSAVVGSAACQRFRHKSRSCAIRPGVHGRSDISGRASDRHRKSRGRDEGSVARGQLESVVAGGGKSHRSVRSRGILECRSARPAHLRPRDRHGARRGGKAVIAHAGSKDKPCPRRDAECRAGGPRQRHRGRIIDDRGRHRNIGGAAHPISRRGDCEWPARRGCPKEATRADRPALSGP